MDERKDERIVKAGDVLTLENGQTCVAVNAGECLASDVVKIVAPQISTQITVQVDAGKFEFKPTRDISAYQLALVTRLLISVATLRGWWAIDDAFAEVYAETKEHWEKVG